MVRYLFYTIGDLTYQSPLVFIFEFLILLNEEVNAANECRKNLDFNRNLSSLLSLGNEIAYFCNKTEKKESF